MERTAGAIPPPVDHRRQSRQREQAEILLRGIAISQALLLV